jgi:hypothetical protein
MADEEGPFVFGKFTQGLWGAALYAQTERSRPWTRDEVHAYLMKHKGVDSMKKVLLSDHDELLAVFAGEPVPVDTPTEKD